MAIEAPVSKFTKTNLKIYIAVCLAAVIIFAYDGYLSKYEWSLRHGFYEAHTEGLLFSVGLEFQNDLDKGVLLEQLQQGFEENKIPLSQNTHISVEQAGSRWLITDKIKKYSVREEYGTLNIYVKELLFTVDFELQSDLDNGIISKQLQQKFEQNKMQLSKGTIVSIEQAGSQWLITSKSKKYCVSKDEGGLNIYTEGGQPDSTMNFNRKAPPFFFAAGVFFGVYLFVVKKRKLIADENELVFSAKEKIPYDSIEAINKTYFEKKGFFIITYKNESGKQLDRKITERKYDNLPAVLDHLVAKIS